MKSIVVKSIVVKGVVYICACFLIETARGGELRLGPTALETKITEKEQDSETLRLQVLQYDENERQVDLEFAQRQSFKQVVLDNTLSDLEQRARIQNDRIQQVQNSFTAMALNPSFYDLAMVPSLQTQLNLEQQELALVLAKQREVLSNASIAGMSEGEQKLTLKLLIRSARQVVVGRLNASQQELERLARSKEVVDAKSVKSGAQGRRLKMLVFP